MKITTEGNLKEKIPEFYTQTFSLLFFPEDNTFGKNSKSENHIKIFIDKTENIVDISAHICYNKKSALKSAKIEYSQDRDFAMDVGKLFYAAASEITGICPPWGIHTGIRPAKTAGDIFEKNATNEEKTIETLCGGYLMQKSKAALALETYKNGRAASCESFGSGDYSLYVSIPFCPTKCRYCSFVSFATPRLLGLVPEYVKKLSEEMKLIGGLAHKMRLKTIYVGGGTPTALGCESLETVLGAIKENFDLSHLAEYTVECGRADTITEKKLELLKSFGAGRISVNPQTLNDEILEKIGRNHSAKDFFRAFGEARKIGIENINTDCIIGLADEPEESMIKTAETLAMLRPENITVHALCVKKSAELKFEKAYSPDMPMLCKTLEAIYSILKSAGYRPYYMYRQKYAAGNLENTGFCLEGRECLYNIYMMDELMTIFGAGAGAMTKIVKNGQIERIANYKYPYEYIERDFQINRENNKEKLKILEGM